MSEFFQSEVVRAELAEIQELQEEVYGNFFKFPSMSKEDQLYHIDILQDLIEKQKIVYTRLSLSDDPEAKMMKDSIIQSAKSMGLPSNVDVNLMFDQMSKMVEMMRGQLDLP
mgnify:CR=1 FL=1